MSVSGSKEKKNNNGRDDIESRREIKSYYINLNEHPSYFTKTPHEDKFVIGMCSGDVVVYHKDVLKQTYFSVSYDSDEMLSSESCFSAYKNNCEESDFGQKGEESDCQKENDSNLNLSNADENNANENSLKEKNAANNFKKTSHGDSLKQRNINFYKNYSKKFFNECSGDAQKNEEIICSPLYSFKAHKQEFDYLESVTISPKICAIENLDLGDNKETFIIGNEEDIKIYSVKESFGPCKTNLEILRENVSNCRKQKANKDNCEDFFNEMLFFKSDCESNDLNLKSDSDSSEKNIFANFYKYSTNEKKNQSKSIKKNIFDENGNKTLKNSISVDVNNLNYFSEDFKENKPERKLLTSPNYSSEIDSIDENLLANIKTLQELPAFKKAKMCTSFKSPSASSYSPIDKNYHPKVIKTYKQTHRYTLKCIKQISPQYFLSSDYLRINMYNIFNPKSLYNVVVDLKPSKFKELTNVITNLKVKDNSVFYFGSSSGVIKFYDLRISPKGQEILSIQPAGTLQNFDNSTNKNNEKVDQKLLSPNLKDDCISSDTEFAESEIEDDTSNLSCIEIKDSDLFNSSSSVEDDLGDSMSVNEFDLLKAICDMHMHDNSLLVRDLRGLKMYDIRNSNLVTSVDIVKTYQDANKILEDGLVYEKISMKVNNNSLYTNGYKGNVEVFNLDDLIFKYDVSVKKDGVVECFDIWDDFLVCANGTKLSFYK
ncbi:hypothetical protein EDEG_02288 [Edhazardia aedis USNM 41457]|uniref:Uncharacterized protein n=1 Tax=Edhazardia aedis (strain USNM 41457) TaxID=1003232 RepID=J8ZUM2_EDHAE|nr:hypothetical protein EDEG_02288 [Edhazardia aedis USNM 41457]|eukprot:EJW03378.1 hypothetical protein EDEG_02288 [Edhazardia aedis USNM 41457]